NGESFNLYSVTVDGETRTLQSQARTVGEFLAEQGVTLHLQDQVFPAYASRLQANDTVTVTRAQAFTAVLDGTPRTLYTTAQTVGGALAQVGIGLNGGDWSVPAPDEPLPANRTVQVLRWQERLLSEQAPLPFDSLSQAIPNLPLDQTQLIATGQAGLLLKQTRLTTLAGQEVRRIGVAEWQALAPQDRIVGYGTQVVEQSMDTPDGLVVYYRALSMYATSYSASRAGKSPTSRSYGITASGQRLTKGLVAVDRSLIPLGTRLYIPGYGFAVAADTGGGVKGRMIDLGYDDENYISWHQTVTVYFLAPAPADILWVFP
ncbi:MAG TPA: ubiquitin-like domain-containing protein, partial [Anaerolineales bacterium]|nr:ubiquitin-like domain-containing protein [Anaerolineales bacterium]